MASTKIVLRENKAKTNGETPLYIRIIKDRKARFISLGITIDPKFWDPKNSVVKKAHPNSGRMNKYLAKKMADAVDAALDLQTESDYVSPKSLKEAIMGLTTMNFIQYAKQYRDNLEKKGKIGTFDKAKAVISKLEQFIGNKDFTFDEVTPYFLKKYEEHLRTHKNNSTNTIHSNLKVIRRIINEAISEDLFPAEKNPFLKYKLKWENIEKAFLTEEELDKLANLNLTEGSMKYHHRNIYVFAAYAGGLRISDICQLKWDNFDGERILVNTMKTGSIVSIKLPKKALEIISLYKKVGQDSNDYIFPFLDSKKDYSNPRAIFQAISSTTAYTNTDLKDLAKLAGLKQKLHFHTSRHTWATRALRKGMRIEYVSKLMGHNSIKTTQVYAKIVNKELDDAMGIFDIDKD